MTIALMPYDFPAANDNIGVERHNHVASMPTSREAHIAHDANKATPRSENAKSVTPDFVEFVVKPLVIFNDS